MTNPVLMVVDGDPGSLATLDDTLRRRYGHDYLIISEATPETALGRLRELRDADHPVAVVMAAAEGTGQLEALTLTDSRTDSTQTVPAAALVILIGAVPHTHWLPPNIARDEHGFILTGSDLPASGDPAASWALPRPPHPLETSMPGVFAAGDVRHGSVKRVASAVGEGSIATTQVSQFLQTQARNS